jgi:hypothetical protein
MTTTARAVLAALALALLSLPATAGASDGMLARLSLRHLNGTAAVLNCTTTNGCAVAFTRELNALNAITQRGSVRILLVGSKSCQRAASHYVAIGTQEIDAAKAWMRSPTPTRHAQFYLAVTRTNATLVPLARAC